MKRILIAVVFISGCAYLQTPQGKAMLATSETIANVALSAAASAYGGPAAGQLASAGLDALGTVLQGYIDKPVPSTVVKAAPGITAVGKAVAPLVPVDKPITQGDVNTVYKAAAIAAKK